MALVVLDAGHGGSNPGAVYNGRQEKDDALALTLERTVANTARTMSRTHFPVPLSRLLLSDVVCELMDIHSRTVERNPLTKGVYYFGAFPYTDNLQIRSGPVSGVYDDSLQTQYHL